MSSASVVYLFIYEIERYKIYKREIEREEREEGQRDRGSPLSTDLGSLSQPWDHGLSRNQGQQVPLLLKDGATGHSCCFGPESRLDAAFQSFPFDGHTDL